MNNERRRIVRELAIAALSFRPTPPEVTYPKRYQIPYLSARLLIGIIIGMPLLVLLYLLLKNWPTAVAGPLATGIINLLLGLVNKK